MTLTFINEAKHMFFKYYLSVRYLSKVFQIVKCLNILIFLKIKICLVIF